MKKGRLGGQAGELPLLCAEVSTAFTKPTSAGVPGTFTNAPPYSIKAFFQADIELCQLRQQKGAAPLVDLPFSSHSEEEPPPIAGADARYTA